MSKYEIIDCIMEINKTAKQDFLDQFSTADLDLFLITTCVHRLKVHSISAVVTTKALLLHCCPMRFQSPERS